MGALNSVPFCSRGSADDNNNLSGLPDLNLEPDETVAGVVVETQPEATSTPKAARVEDSGDVASVHEKSVPTIPVEPTPARIQTTPPPYNSLDGDSGLEHSADEVDLQEYSENSLDSEDGDEVDLNGTLSEDADEKSNAEEKKQDVKKQVEDKEKIDFSKLEEEILGDDMVEPVTDTNEDDEDVEEEQEERRSVVVDDLDITEHKIMGGKRNTTDMITDMLNQMVVDGGSRDLATR